MNLKITAFIFSIFLILSINEAAAQNEDKLVVFQTKAGNLVIELFPNDAPNTVDNFLKLAESGFYDSTFFHRVIKDFMIQGGDPKTKPGGYVKITEWGTGNAGYTIDAEFNLIKHNRGIVSMARSADPNSASSQFFIVDKDSNFLDGKYTAFGRLITQESYETLDKITALEIAANDIPVRWGNSEITKTFVVNRGETPDLLDLGEPNRLVKSSGEISENLYSNDQLGFSILFPLGWLIQEPIKTDDNIPDVVAIGSTINKTPAVIYVSIVENIDNKSFDDYILTVRNLFEPDSTDRIIISEERKTINGLDAYVLTVEEFLKQNDEVIPTMFKSVTFSSETKFYAIVYSNSKENFDLNLQQFEEAVNSFTLLSIDKQKINDNEIKNLTESENGGCLIATATFGSELAPQVQFLREIRDNTVLKTVSGTSFMTGFNTIYYSFSPAVADLERQNPLFKQVVKVAITPLLSTLSLLNYVEIDSEQEMLGYGLSIILLNIGMYFVAPAVLIYKLKNRN